MPTPPSNGSVTSPFGMRNNPNDGKYRMHYGEDTIGVGNYSPVTGTVVFAGYDRTGTGLGWAVGIRETANPSRIWWVAHHGKSALVNPLKVTVGRKVSEKFTYLGAKGVSGAAKGEHAHTECRVNGAAIPGSGTAVNPRGLYSGGGSAGGGGTSDESDEDEMASDLIYYCNSASKDGTIAHEAMFYQECIGAPIFPFTGYKSYKASAAVSEYAAFKGRYQRGDDYNGVRIPISGDDMKKLIALRGVASKPVGNFETVSGGSITINSDPAVVALLEKVLAKIPTKAVLS